MIDVRNKLFIKDGVLYEAISWHEGIGVHIKPVREEDYQKCECGRPFPDQFEHHVMSAPNLQDHISGVYELKEVSDD